MPGELVPFRQVNWPQHFDAVNESEVLEEIRQSFCWTVHRDHVDRRWEADLGSVREFPLRPTLR